MIIPVLLLLSLGIVIIYTSSPTLAIQQLIFSVIGLILFFLLGNFDYRDFKGLIKPLYIIALGLLVVTLLLGFETRGSIRWIPLGLFNLQPSEFSKVVLILALAGFWSKHEANFINIGKSIILTAPILILIFRQPDLGTTLTVGFIWLTILFAANISFFKILLLSLLSMLIAPLIWLTLHDYQKQRIYTFLSPANDPKGEGFHVIQSTIAVGSGELLGRGLGRGTQSRLQFLPEFRTDFIFAFIAEELGFLGSLIVIVLYLVLFYLLLNMMSKVEDKFAELLIVGVCGMLFFQIVVNIGMNIGIVPITGITLPFLSYGGSSIITTLMALGLINSIQKYGLKQKNSGNLFNLIKTS
jgi:rod shape determining protein RodA